jgi:hypothetical protein
MGILRTFERIGDGMIGLFFKFMLFLIIIVIILVALIGIATYWKFFIGILIGGLFSPILYSYLEKNLKLGLPEFFFWNYGDVVEAFFGSEEDTEEAMMDLKQKKKAARAELLELDKKYENLKVAFEDLKAKKDIDKMVKGKDAKNISSSRMRKAILMSIGDPEWVSEIRDVRTEVDWKKYL